ncbi:hypothetical protein ACIOJD_24830 [Streptomyces sp. NPDC088116]|uniref:hypothetical protein n=1 Tax=Streptomyces sp. NPDC088116 TaxID=3365825 RepID=UPI0038106332
MRAIRAASAALLSVAALALTAPTAAAAVNGGSTRFGYTVSPSTVAPGGRVTLSVTNCASSATASSAVFDTVTVTSGRPATATVDWDAKPGASYRVTFSCNGTTGTRTLTIARAPSTPTASSTSILPAGVQGGLGGSVGGVSAAEIVAGTALVVTAATGTIYAVRRRADARAH